MNTINFFKNGKVNTFQNGIVIPLYILLDGELDLSKKLILASLVHLWKNEFNRKGFVVRSDFFDLGCSKNDVSADEIMNWFHDHLYLIVLGKFKSMDNTWYHIDITPDYEPYIEHSESAEDQLDFLYSGYYSTITDWVENLSSSIMEVPEEWESLLGFLESKSQYENKSV